MNQRANAREHDLNPSHEGLYQEAARGLKAVASQERALGGRHRLAEVPADLVARWGRPSEPGCPGRAGVALYDVRRSCLRDRAEARNGEAACRLKRRR
jgi:hypothetical protein